MGVCGAERGGLIVSCTRLFSFGPIDGELKRRHQAVCQIDAAMINASRPGKTIGSVFAVGQKAYSEASFPDEWRHHHQGGSTGYVGREVRATPGNSTEILPNQPFAWNPSITGTKSEDTILVTPGDNAILSFTGNWPTSRYVVDGASYLRSDILVL
jgi:Xaa-Pro dipeptidase